MTTLARALGPLLLALAAGSGLAPLSTAVAEPAEPAGSQGAAAPRRFESETLGLGVTLPDGWDVRAGSAPVVVTARSGAKGMSVVALRRPGRGESAPLSDGEVAELWESAVGDIPFAAHGATPSGQGDATLSGRPARFAWSRVAGPPGGAAAVMLYTVTGGRGDLLVRLTLVVPQPEYRAARQAFDAAVKTFSFTR